MQEDGQYPGLASLDDADAARSGHGARDLRGFGRFVRRRWRTIAIVALACTAVAYGRAALQSPEYQATATILFGSDPTAQFLGRVDTTPGDPTLPGSATQTDLRLITQRPVAIAVKRALRARETPESLLSRITVEQQGVSSLANINARAGTPAGAARLATTWAQVFARYKAQQERARVQAGINRVKADLASLTGVSHDQQQILKGRLGQLETLNAVQSGTVSVTQAATLPTVPSSPHKALSAAIGLFLGLVLGFAIALIREQLDRRLRDADEIESAFRLPLLGTVPESKLLASSGRGRPPPGSPEADAFRMVRASLRYFNVTREIRSVLVTSALPKEGKSVTAWNVAEAAAASGERVLLIEADLRNPVLAARLGLSARKGLSQLLTGQATLEDVTVGVPLPSAAPRDGQDAPEVDVILAGRTPPNPIELIESPAMSNLISDAEGRYDLVIIDTPPVMVIPDAISLIRGVNGVIVVSRIGQTTREAATALRERLRGLHAPTLGLIVNSVAPRDQYHGYGYGYGEGVGAKTALSRD